MGVQGQIGKEIERARQAGRMLVMISYIDKETELLHHRTLTDDFPVKEFETCMMEHAKHLKEQAAKAGKGAARGAQGSEEIAEDPTA